MFAVMFGFSHNHEVLFLCLLLINFLMVLLLLMLFYLLVSFKKTGNYFLQYCLRYLLLAKSILPNPQVLLVCYYFILMELQMMPLFEVFYAHPDQTYFLDNLIIIYQVLMKLYLIFVMIVFY